MRRAARWPLLAWCLLLALGAPRRAAAKLPVSVPHSVACAACNGTLLALAAHVTAQRHRMGLGACCFGCVHLRAHRPHARAWPCAENAVTDALEVVCDQSQRLLTTYAMPPLRMKQGCVFCASALRHRRSRPHCHAAASRWWSTMVMRCQPRCTLASRQTRCTRASARQSAPQWTPRPTNKAASRLFGDGRSPLASTLP